MLKEALSHLRKHITLTIHIITLCLFITKLLIIIHASKELFNQPAFEMYTETEQLPLKAAKKQDITDELKVHRNFEGDYDAKSIGLTLNYVIYLDARIALWYLW